MKIETHQALQFFIDHGFKIVPCYSKTDCNQEHPFKSPKVKNFTSENYKGLTVEQAEGKFIGLVIPKGYQVLDLDVHNENGIEKCKSIFSKLDLKYQGIVNTTQSNGKHLFFKLPPNAQVYTKCGKKSPHQGIDGRKEGNYVCAYSFSGSLEIMELSREQWAKLLGELENKKLKDIFGDLNGYNGFENTNDIKDSFEQLNDGEEIKENEGRNSYLTSYAGHLIHTESITLDDLLERVEEENQRVCNPPLSLKESNTIAKSVYRYRDENEPHNSEQDEKEDNQKQVLKKYELSDLGSAEWLRDKFNDVYRYCPDHKDWYHWIGKVWARDNTLKHGEAAINYIKAWFEEEKIKYDGKGREVLKDYIKSIKKSYSRIERIINTTKNLLAISPDEFDSNDDLLNFENGVLNLSTDEFHEHRKEDYQTKKCNCDYDEKEKPSKLFIQFLNDIFVNDQEMIGYVQKIFGSAIRGNIEKQEFFILHGQGENGKSQLIAVFQELFGSYTHSMGAEKIMESRYANNDTYLAQLKNVRALFCTEPKEGAHLDVSLVKKLTDEHMKFNVAQKYEKPQQFKLKCISFLITNHKPIVKDTSIGAWRRIKLIPFEYQVPKEKRILRYADRLLESGREGIANWFIEGFRKAKEEGITTPEKVKASSEKYKNEQDDIESFLKDCCELSNEYTVSSIDLLNAFDNWNGSKRKTHANKFTPKMIAKGFEQIEINRRMHFQGIRLKNNLQEMEDF